MRDNSEKTLLELIAWLAEISEPEEAPGLRSEQQWHGYRQEVHDIASAMKTRAQELQDLVGS